MDRTAFVFDTLKQIEFVEKPDELMKILMRVGEQFGLGKACAITSIPDTYHNFEQYSYAERWPKGWHERYLERAYLDNDPIIKALRRSHNPVVWHEVVSHTELDSAASTIMSEATEFGLRAGFNVPIRSINGQLATIMFSGEKFELSRDDMPGLLLISIYAHDKIRELMGVRPIHPKQLQPLTPREIEVLKWTAEGKSSRDIATILSVKVPTVESHICNLCRKLEVSSRVHATARAFRWGIIS